jgi:hypothetical protein
MVWKRRFGSSDEAFKNLSVINELIARLIDFTCQTEEEENSIVSIN